MSARWFLIPLLLTLCACTGIRAPVTAKTADVPISMNSKVFDRDFNVISSNGFERVGSFRRQDTHWGILFGQVPLTDSDYSALINQEVAKSEGDAVINFQVKHRQNYGCWLMGLLVGSFVPVLPACGTVVVSGDVVRVTPASSS